MTPPPKITAADRYLRHTGIAFLIAIAIAIGLGFVFAPATDSQLAHGEAWRDYARFGANAFGALALVWLGFQLSIGLAAKKGDSAALSWPALAICGLAAAFVAQQAARAVMIHLTDTTTIALNGLFNMLCIAIFVISCLTVLWFLIQKFTGAMGDLRGQGHPVEHSEHRSATGDQYAAVNDLALQALHKTIMGDEQDTPPPAGRGRRK